MSEFREVLSGIIEEMAGDFVVYDRWADYDEFAEAVLDRLEVHEFESRRWDVMGKGPFAVYRIGAVERAQAGPTSG